MLVPVNETIYPTWFIINLDGCCTESFVPVDCKQSYWWFGRPHRSFGAIIGRIRKWNHVIEYFVSENINVLISYCLKENEIRPLRWATAICVFKLLRRKIDKWGKTPLPEQDCAHSFSQHESYWATICNRTSLSERSVFPLERLHHNWILLSF